MGTRATSGGTAVNPAIQPSFDDVRRGASVDGAVLEALLGRVDAGPRELLGEITRAIVARLGDRGSCVLVGDGARVVLSTAAPEMFDFPVDLALYPEIAAALASGEVVAIEDVRSSTLLRPVADLLPSHLGAVAVVPLLAGNRALGVIMVQSEVPRRMSAGDVATARLGARLAGTLLDLQFGRDLPGKMGSSLAGVSALGSSPPEAPPGDRSRPRSQSQSQSQSPPVAHPSRGRILIAEDDFAQARELGEILAEEGFDVVLASDGGEAIRLAQEALPDVILLDVHMPLVDGFDTAERLWRDLRTRFVPILLVSGADDLLPRVRQLNMDTVDFLRKPYSISELLARIERSVSQAAEREHLRARATIDELTGLGNMRFLREHLDIERSRTGRYGTPLSVVMMDVDKLKKINDDHGHIMGSEILKAIAEALRCEIRETDLAARYGGDEFVVVLPHTSLVAAEAFAQRVLSRIRRLRVDEVSISVSLGVAQIMAQDGGATDAVLGWADSAAYRAKRLGGDRVCVYDQAADGDGGPAVIDLAASPRDQKASPGVG
jgi:two-component system cell cycle response regulator